MKMFLTMLAVALIAFGVVHFTLAKERRPDAVGLTKHLQLDPSQQQKIATLEADFAKNLDAACAAHCAARRELGEELAQPTVDPVKAQACVDKMNAAQNSAEQATLAHILKVRSLLNASQARRYSTLIQDQVCNMPMGGR